MPKINHTLRHIFYLFGLVVITHGFILLSHGSISDGALYNSLQQYGDFRGLRGFYMMCGLPTQPYIFKLLWNIGAGDLTYNLIAFFSFFCVSLFLYLIIKAFDIFSQDFALVTAVLFIVVPNISFSFCRDMIPYMIFYVMFFCAFYLGILANNRQGVTSFLLRVLAAVMFFFSFGLNSLLMFYLLFVLCDFYFWNNLKVHLYIIEGIKYVFSRAYYLMLPFIYWGVKKAFFSPYGFYPNYNRMGWISIKHTLYMYWQFFLVSTGPHFLFVIFILFCIFVSIINYFVYKNAESNDFKNKKKYLYLVVFGILAWFLGITPYVLVGKVPGMVPWPNKAYDSRLLLLAAPSIAFILASIIFFVFKKNEKINLSGRLILILVFSILVTNYWSNYLIWEGAWAVKQSVKLRFNTHKDWGNFSIYFINNHFAEGYGHPLSEEWNFVLDKVYGGRSRDAVGIMTPVSAARLAYVFENMFKNQLYQDKSPVLIEQPPLNQYEKKYLSNRKVFLAWLKKDYKSKNILSIRKFSPSGKVAIVDIIPGSLLYNIMVKGKSIKIGKSKNNLNYVGLLYEYYRFFDRNKLNEYLFSLLEVNLVPFPGLIGNLVVVNK